MFSLDHLNGSLFEEFCYDLLNELDFRNISWRKGTGISSSPADQGRDIVAELAKTEVDKTVHLERWFVECKHHKRGVSPEKLQAAITWATSERPDVLLFVVSNFLSNPARAYLDSYRRNNRPPFRIKLWEKKDLETLTAGRQSLRSKYSIKLETEAANPYHMQYILLPPRNSLDFFFEVMDRLDTSKRDEVFGTAYYFVINPRFRKERHFEETLAECKLDPTDYKSFQEKCYKLSEKVIEEFLVHAIVTSTLAYFLRLSDSTRIDEIIAFHQDAITYFSGKLEKAIDREEQISLKGCISLSKSKLITIHEDTERFYELYTYVCEELVSELILEEPLLGKADI